MAQKRNPISLRLQTRLRGHEKRFASCWFTDSFFSQVYADDLVKRMYLGHLLQKGGSWYAEVSESRVPETCISIQFLYRKCSILSVILDRRKEEYLFENSFKGVKFRSNPTKLGESLSTLSRQEGMTPQIAVGKEISDTYPHLKDKGGHLWVQAKRKYTRKDMAAEQMLINATQLYAGLCSPKDWLTDWRSDQKHKIIPDSLYLLAISSICNNSASKRETHFPFSVTDLVKESDSQSHALALSQPSETGLDLHVSAREKREYRSACKKYVFANTCKEIRDSFINLGDGQREDLIRTKQSWVTSWVRALITPVIPACHWTSCTFVRGLSAYQSVEFCLYSVAFLYKKRFSFLQIKDTLFRMLASNGSVRGARLVCSGRQGGRSKSAMRARKQSALWGQTPLSLFSSRLAFASTSVDTAFGQVGIKIWICYK